MQLKSLLFALFLLGCFFSYGQSPYYNQRPEFLKANNHWAFGDRAGLDFTPGSPVAVQYAMKSSEGSAAISDPNTGKLLFYSNGEQCWNANNLVMPNGDSLLGNSKYSSASSGSTSQGVCIFPVIGEPGKYYLFSLVGLTSSRPNYTLGSLFYSVIDMSLDNGLGDIQAGRKNIALNYDILSEAMIAIPGANCDIWLMLHAYEKEEFITYHITKEGIDTNAVISNTGGAAIPYSYAGGFLGVSPDRKKIVMNGSNTNTLICEFNASTGQVTNAIKLALPGAGGRNPCFSPDNSKLYLSQQKELLQFDISVYDSAVIRNSMASIATLTTYSWLRLYNDTIYFKVNRSVLDGIYIDRINKPNLAGAACNFERGVIELNPGTTAVAGMGNESVLPLPPDTFSALALDTTICPKENLILQPLVSYNNPIWNDGSVKPTKTVNQAGVYWVLQNDGCHANIDTFNVKFFDFEKPIITVDVLELGTVSTYSDYQWLLNGNIISGANSGIYKVVENGDYQVVVSNGDCIDTSVIYTVTNANETSISGAHQLREQIRIYPNPAKDLVYIKSPVVLNISILDAVGRTISEAATVSEISLKGWAKGLYLLRMTDKQGNLIKIEKIVKQ